MAASTTTCLPIPASAPVACGARVRPIRRRIDPQAGHALEILGHAIEYLTDEFIHNAVGFPANHGELEAVQLLMAVNRQIYFACPEAPSFGERCRSFLHLHPA